MTEISAGLCCFPCVRQQALTSLQSHTMSIKSDKWIRR
ncbi:MAG: hypothetical protein ACI9M6_000373, partial [Hydrogenophaga sp.]